MNASVAFVLSRMLFGFTFLALALLPASAQQATGHITNYVVSWRVISYEENIVEVEQLILIELEGGSLSRYGHPLMDTRYGQVSNTSDIEITEDGQPMRYAYRSEDTSETVTMSFRNGIFKAPGTRLIRIAYNTTGSICEKDGKQGIIGTWASQFSNANVYHVEYDFTVPIPYGLDNSSMKIDLEPEGESTKLIQDNQITLFAVYGDGESIGISTQNTRAEPVFFSWEPKQEVADMRECYVVKDDYTFIIVLGAIGASGCVCCIGLALYQRFFGPADSPSGFGMNLFSNNRDIVLGPNGDRGEPTVRAMLENEDDQAFNDELGTMTITVNLDPDDLPRSSNANPNANDTDLVLDARHHTSTAPEQSI